MSFFKNFSKKKSKFYFYILIQSMTHLPFHHNGSSLQCQVKRKDKVEQTKFAKVMNGHVDWEDFLVFETSLFTADGGKTWDGKSFAVRIKNMNSESGNYLMDFELNVADFVKNNSRMEVSHTVCFPPDFCFDEADAGVQYADSTSTPGERGKKQNDPPQLHMIIRSYCEGINKDRAEDFTAFLKTDGDFVNPLLSGSAGAAPVVKAPPQAAQKTFSFVQEQEAGGNEEDSEDQEDARRRAQRNNDRRGTRKVSVMFNAAMHDDAPGGGQRGSVHPHQRPSTYRFSTVNRNAPTFDAGFDDDSDDDSAAYGRGRMLSTTGGGPNFGNIGEDSDYD